MNERWAWNGASAAALHMRREALDAWLANWAWLWRSQPFKESRPGWCERVPELAHALLQLDDGRLAHLAANADALTALLASHVPALRDLTEWVALPAATTEIPLDCGPRLRMGIPGRKRAQIEALAAAVNATDFPLLEWCGGKGHLGRLLAACWNTPTTTLERDAALCAQGTHLAAHGRVTQRFLLADALSGPALEAARGHHVVALHACGELHRVLLRQAALLPIPALDIVPCCYHHLSATTYVSFCTENKLTLSRDDLRLAVTDTATSGQRVIRRRDQDMAWKLGFNLLRTELSGAQDYQPILPVPPRWLEYGFENYCHRLAKREGVTLPARIDWTNIERAAWKRQAQVMRLSLVRHGFRRAVEMWLAIDMACHLAGHGFEVQISTFCDWRTTPRNILLSARR